ncbi:MULTISPECIES: FAD-binding oxidoreductase [unclassified Pseudoclavibacter]|uniref:NAD(P)/FAD-dependent oxidoreductase n=1 Tax=unclassified Pseudoclavibacter TaxID=2615177 RepID=UPI000CE8F882|nr:MULTISPECIES: FAD-binding oxidoreductase [unclassified Pseudoclavibacter]MBF4550221.1 FAD-binding oxidoreductase [Pseudoclavibacter sp. VKM Ac-2888]PPF38679.1 FAD-dependent oxidoreductase [Pseudoclavibacter sp. AY1H1]
MVRYDVVIIGGGIIGAACAAELAGRGRRVALVERGRVASGTSAHCEGNLLVSDKGPGAELELSKLANAAWSTLAGTFRDELGHDFPDIEFEAKGGLVVATTDGGAAALLDFASTQRHAQVAAEPVTHAEARELEPWITERMTAAVWYPGDSQVQPTIATEALVALARARGASILEHHDVLGAIREAGRIVGVRTSAGDVRGAEIVVAAGPWSGEVSATLGVPLPVRPRRGVVLVTAKMPQRVFHKVYDADYVGAVGSGDAVLMTSSVVESTPGGTVLIGSSREQVGFDDAFRANVLSQLAVKAISIFPFLAQTAVIRSYSGFRPFMPDHLPLIGQDARLPGLWHATGHEGAGIGLSLPTASLIGDLMDGRSTQIDAALFSPTRPTLARELEAVA